MGFFGSSITGWAYSITVQKSEYSLCIRVNPYYVGENH